MMTRSNILIYILIKNDCYSVCYSYLNNNLINYTYPVCTKPFKFLIKLISVRLFLFSLVSLDIFGTTYST